MNKLKSTILAIVAMVEKSKRTGMILKADYGEGSDRRGSNG
jgi:hypothetical protein